MSISKSDKRSDSNQTPKTTLRLDRESIRRLTLRSGLRTGMGPTESEDCMHRPTQSVPTANC